MSATFSVSHNQYVNNLPKNIGMKAAQGFVVSSAITLIAGATLSGAATVGAVAVAATVIEALCRPIIKSIFPQNPTIATWIQICVPLMVAGSLSAPISGLVGLSTKGVYFFLSLAAWISLNNQFYERNQAMAVVF